MLLPPCRHILSFALAFFWLLSNTGCGKRNEPAVAKSELPPVAKPADAPEYLRSLSLLYPQAELYQVTAAEKTAGKTGTILQKTNHPLEDVVHYYADTLRKHGFTETTHLVQGNAALLQYERQADKHELVSVDISKLPYAENLLIRIGRSEIDYGHSGAP